MKKFLSALLIACALLTLVSCGDSEYKPVKSSDLEAQTAFTLTIDGTEYQVRYELYRALFLSYKEEIDGGDPSVWNGDNKEEYISRIDEIIIKQAAEIYSVLHVAKKTGINVYSDKYNKVVEGYISASVKGGYYDEIYLEGFGGDYSKYLESLKEMNLNYSVHDLLLRYSLAYEAIYDHYAGTLDSEFISEAQKGALEYSREDVEAFYYSDEDSVRIRRAYIPKNYTTPERVNEIRAGLIEAAESGETAALRYLINQSSTTTSPKDIENGEVLGRYSLDRMYYAEMTKAAFALGIEDVSEVIEIATVNDEAYVIMYRVTKNNAHFSECYDSIASAYVQNEIGKILYEASTTLIESASAQTMLTSLDRSTISMD